MYVRKFARTDTCCSILWSSESRTHMFNTLNGQQACKHISMVEQHKMRVTAVFVAAKNSRK
jgi:hypothetical protein